MKISIQQSTIQKRNRYKISFRTRVSKTNVIQKIANLTINHTKKTKEQLPSMKHNHTPIMRCQKPNKETTKNNKTDSIRKAETR
jgi:hypothetical protein